MTPNAEMDCIVNEDNWNEWEWRGPVEGGNESKEDKHNA